jgi:hypothetical protein
LSLRELNLLSQKKKKIELANLISEREFWLELDAVISANSQSAIAYVGFEEEQTSFVGFSTSKM